MASTLVAIGTDGTKHFLDLMKGQPISLDFNFKDITDLKTKGSYSYNFRLPSSIANDKFFANYYMVGSKTDGTNNNYNPFTKLEAYLLQDTIEVFSGYIQLSNVYLREGNRYEYEVLLFAPSISLLDDLKGVNLGDTLGDTYNHDYNVSTIYNSWHTNSIASGKVVYSLYDYGSGVSTNLADTFIMPASTGGIEQGQNMFDIQHLRPQIQLKEVLTKISQHVGYVFNSAFFDTAVFEKIYVDCNYGTNAQLPTPTSYNAYNVILDTNAGQSFTTTYGSIASISTSTNWLPTNELQDLTGQYNTSTGEFTPAVLGLWNLFVGGTITVPNTMVGSDIRIRLYKLVNGTIDSYTDLEQFGFSTTPLTRNWSANVQLPITATGSVKYVIRVFSGYSFNLNGTTLTFTNSFAQWSLLQGYDTEQVNVGNLFGELKASDFLSSIIRKFNLVLIPDKSNSKVITIEPFNSYMAGGTTKDWSDKIDFKKDVQILPPSKIAPKSILFADQNSKDYVNQTYVDTSQRIYGQHERFTDNQYTDKTTKFTSIFSPTIPYPVPAGNFYTSPVIEINEGEYKNVGGVRLSFYHGEKTIGSNLRIRITDSYSQLANQNEGIQYEEVPNFSPFSATGFSNDASVYSINWSCSLSNDIVAYESIPLRGLAEEFWEQYIFTNFDVNARMLIAYMRLSQDDISNFKFNDLINVNGNSYFINSIKGYPVSSTGLCKVELLKSDGFFSNDTIYNGINCGNLNDLYSKFGIIHNATDNPIDNQNCCDAFGYYWRNGSFGNLCYNTPATNTTPSGDEFRSALFTENSNIVGSGNISTFTDGGVIRGNNNNISVGGRDILVKGDLNRVESNCRKLEILGDDNLIKANSNNVSITGTGNIVFPQEMSDDINGEKIQFQNSLSNIQITGEYGKALNNNEIILSKGQNGVEGKNQTSEYTNRFISAGTQRNVYVGQNGALATLPDQVDYNTILGELAFRLPDKSVIDLTIEIQATTDSESNTLKDEYWKAVYKAKIISGTGTVIYSQAQVSSETSTKFVGSTMEVISVSNIPYLYNGYMLEFTLPFSTLVNDSSFTIVQKYNSTMISGSSISNFLPSQLTDLKAWFDASNFSSLSFTSTIGSSQPINAWKDLSDNNNNVSQTNASNQPIWISGTANRGRPYLGFNGSTSCLFNNASGLISLPNESYTMFAVFESDITTHEEYGQVITGINKSDGTPIGGVNINPLATHGGGGTDSVSFYNKNTLTNLYENHISTAGVTDPKIIVGRKNGTALDIIDENGSTDTSTGINSTDGAYFTIGALVNSTIDAEFDGKIYEVIVVGESVSNTDRDKIIYYLKNKWNIL